MTDRTAFHRNRLHRWLGTALIAGACCATGCDVPDRHDIAAFKKPAAWSASADSATAQARNTARPGASAENVRTASATGLSQLVTAPDTSVMPSVAGKPEALQSGRLADEWESWQIHCLRSTILGGIHAKSNRTADNRIRVNLEERGLTYRGLLQILESNEQTFWHDANGNLEKVDCVFRRGPLQSRRLIEVTADEVLFDDDRLVASTRQRMAIDTPLGGPLHVYQTLRRKPLAEGETRVARVLLPIMGEVATLRLQHNSLASPSVLTAQGFQEVVMEEASCLLSLDETRQRESVYWFDKGGNVQLYHVSNEQRFSYGCNVDQYNLLGQEFLNQDYPISLRIPGKPLVTDESVLQGDLQQVGYEIRWAEAPQPEALPSESPITNESASPEIELGETEANINQIALVPRQYLQRDSNPNLQKLVVSRSPVPESKLRNRFDVFAGASSEQDLKPTTLIDFQSATIRRVTGTTVKGRDFTPAERAFELNRTVHSLLSFQPLSKGMRSASEIADSSLADSTEHSILLIAMLRAAGIPSRMVLGIRHQPADTVSSVGASELPFQTRRQVPDGNRFVYHAWVIAEVGDQWIALDPVSGSETTPDCLSIQITDLHDIDPLELIEEYIDRLSRMQLKIYAIVRGV